MARGRYGSVYDSYSLSNSSTIPLFTGTSGPEMLKVGEYLQGLYNTAQSGAIGLEGNLDQLQSLPQDRRLAEELRTNTQGTLQGFARRQDYENLVPDVQRLGVNFANRYRELTAPIQQRAEYQKTLENKDLNLTAAQKASLLDMSDASYRGLQNVGGRYQGGYQGVTPDVNIDVNKWIDDRIKDIAIQKGGSDIVNDNGEWKIKRGTKWERLEPGTIETTLNAAMRNSPEYQGWKNMQGRITGFNASRMRPEALAASGAGANIRALADSQGISLQEAARQYYDSAQRSQIDADALTYAKTKYAVNNRWSESGQEMGALQIHRLTKEADDATTGPGIFGDLVTGQGIDLSTKYGSASDLETKLTEAGNALEGSTLYVEGQRARVAKALGLKNTYATDQQVQQWYAENDPQELGRFRSNKNSIDAMKSSINEMNQVRDAAMDEAVKKYTGNQQTYTQMKKDATKKFQDAVVNGKLDIPLKKDFSGTTFAAFQKGKVTEAITPENAKNWEVVDTQSGIGGGQNWIKVRNTSTGREHMIALGGNPGQGATSLGYSNAKLNDVAKTFSKVSWKDAYAEGTQGLRSNMVWMPLLNKTTPDGQVSKAGAYASRAAGLITAAAASSAIKVKDNNDKDLDSDDANDIRTLIAAGKYNLLGIGIDPNTGESRMSLSVEVDKDASDVSDRYKTVMIGADTNFWDKISSSVKQAADRDINSSDPAARAAAFKTLQFGLAMQTGSSYRVVGRKTTPSFVKDSSGNTVYEVRPSMTGDPNNPLSYEVYRVVNGKRTNESQPFNSALDLGAYLDVLRASGNTLSTE